MATGMSCPFFVAKKKSGPIASTTSRQKAIQCDQPDLADGIAFMSCPIKEARKPRKPGRGQLGLFLALGKKKQLIKGI